MTDACQKCLIWRWWSPLEMLTGLTTRESGVIQVMVDTQAAYTRGFHPYWVLTTGLPSTPSSLGILGPQMSRSTTPTLCDLEARAPARRKAMVDFPTPVNNKFTRVELLHRQIKYLHVNFHRKCFTWKELWIHMKNCWHENLTPFTEVRYLWTFSGEFHIKKIMWWFLDLCVDT